MPEANVTIRGTRHRSAGQAIQHLSVSGDDHAILAGDMVLSAKQAEVERLAAAGVEFAYLVHHKPTGRIMTIPVNDR